MMDQMAAAYRAGDAPGCAALFTTDAALFSPYASATRGRDAIETLHRVWTVEANSKRFAVVEAGHSGDRGCCLAAYSESV
jgi:ketosteroid isomerase-like protein